jgi:hypothetical protein
LNELFAQTVGRIDVVGGVMRLELATLVPVEGEAPKMEPCGVLVMPMEGFLQSLNMMQEMVQKMAEGGLVRLNPPAAG